MFEHQRAPDHSRTSEVQRWLEQKLPIFRLGSNFPGTAISVLLPFLRP